METTTTVVTAVTGLDYVPILTSSATDITSSLVTLVTQVLPIGLTIVGLSIGIAYAIKFIKKIIK